MRPAALLLVFAVCRAPVAEPGPAGPGGPDPVARLEQTAAESARAGRFTDSNALYARLAKLQPMSPARCTWEIAVVSNTLVIGDKRAQAAELRRLGALDRAFSRAAAPSAAQKQACHREFHDILAVMVRVWNKELTASCTAFSWRNWPYLEALLREFLRDFPDDAQAPEARRQLEDLLVRERAKRGG
jgi:hypothetical protein